eukprot:scaffold108436_cov60-Phaeocystis_antarctica.AAC.3
MWRRASCAPRLPARCARAPLRAASHLGGRARRSAQCTTGATHRAASRPPPAAAPRSAGAHLGAAVGGRGVHGDAGRGRLRRLAGAPRARSAPDSLRAKVRVRAKGEGEGSLALIPTRCAPPPPRAPPQGSPPAPRAAAPALSPRAPPGSG